MKDFPCFATDDGVASLILKEIPYRQEAYIRFQDVQPGRFAPFLQECVSFCRMAGAEKIYAQGHEELSQYPLHAAVYEMRGKAWVDTKLLENIFPVTEVTAPSPAVRFPLTYTAPPAATFSVPFTISSAPLFM